MNQPKIIHWVIKYSGGLVKNESQAIYLLMVFVGLAIIISLFLFFGQETKIDEKYIYNPANTPPDTE